MDHRESNDRPSDHARGEDGEPAVASKASFVMFARVEGRVTCVSVVITVLGQWGLLPLGDAGQHLAGGMLPPL
jgi:hypothetical protein